MAAVWACCGTWPPSSGCAAAASSSRPSSTGRSSFRLDANTTWRLTATWCDHSGGSTPHLPTPSGTNQEAPRGPQDQRHRIHMIYSCFKRKTGGRPRLQLPYEPYGPIGVRNRITHGNTFLGREEVGKGVPQRPPTHFKRPQKCFLGEFFERCIYGSVYAYFLLSVLLIKKEREMFHMCKTKVCFLSFCRMSAEHEFNMKG